MTDNRENDIVTSQDEWVDELINEEDRNAVINQYNAASASANEENELAPEDEQRANDTRHVVCAGAYLIFIIPLLLDRKNPEFRFHARQGLKINILEAIVLFVKPILLTLGAALNSVLIISATSIVSFVLWAAIIVLILLGIYNAWTDHTKELPIPDFVDRRR